MKRTRSHFDIRPLVSLSAVVKAASSRELWKEWQHEGAKLRMLDIVVMWLAVGNLFPRLILLACG